MTHLTFKQFAKAAVICLRAQNYIGAEASAKAMQRLAERDTQRWVADDLLKAAESEDISNSRYLGYLDKPVSSSIGLEMELVAWNLAHDDECSIRSEQVAEHGYDPYWAWENPAEYRFAKMPHYLIALKYPTIEGGWEWPFGDCASTEAFREACRQQSNDIPF